MSNAVTQNIVNALLPNCWNKMVRERSKRERAKFQAELAAESTEAKKLERQTAHVHPDRGYRNKMNLPNFDKGVPPVVVPAPVALMPPMPDYKSILAGIGSDAK